MINYSVLSWQISWILPWIGPKACCQTWFLFCRIQFSFAISSFSISSLPWFALWQSNITGRGIVILVLICQPIYPTELANFELLKWMEQLSPSPPLSSSRLTWLTFRFLLTNLCNFIHYSKYIIWLFGQQSIHPVNKAWEEEHYKKYIKLGRLWLCR